MTRKGKTLWVQLKNGDRDTTLCLKEGRDGALLDDFAFHESPRIVNVINAPSPAATSAFSIAETVVDKLEDHF